MQHGGSVYILTNKYHTVFYTGVTADLQRRLMEHLEKLDPKCFTARYNCTKLVWFQHFGCIEEAIAYEKYVKGKKRVFKIQLIEDMNPEWNDLGEEVKGW